MDIFQVIFENDKVVVECEAERDEAGRCSFFNILVTNKDTGRSTEEIELPDGLLFAAKTVAEATPDDE